MKSIKYVLIYLFLFSFITLKAENTKVDTLIIGILSFQNNEVITNEDLDYVKSKFIKSFTDKTRFKVIQGEELLSILKEDSLNNTKNTYKSSLDFIVSPFIIANKSTKTSIMNDTKVEYGYNAYFSMKIDITNFKTKKSLFNQQIYRTDFYKNKTSNQATSYNIHDFCDLFQDVINYVFPVELKISELQFGNKKEKAETVTILNIEHLYVYIKKGFLDYPSSKFEVYIVNEKGKKEVVGKLEAKKNDANEIEFSIDKGSKDITKLFNSNQTLYVNFLYNSIEYLIKK